MTATQVEDGAALEVRVPLPRKRIRHEHRRRRWLLVIVAAIVASVVTAVSGAGDVMRVDGFGSFLEFFQAALHPRADAGFLGLTATSAITTLAYAVLGTLVSLVIGLVGGVLTSQTWWLARPQGRRAGRVGWFVTRAVLVVPRAIHEVIWGLVLLAVFGLDPMVAVLAIGIPFGAVTAKVFSELIDEAPHGPYTALLAAGSGRLPALVYGIFPGALSDLLSYAFYRFECAIRSAAILGLVGAGGLGFQLALSFQTLQYNEIWTLLYALVVLSIAADQWSSFVRTRRTTRVLGGSAVVAAVLAAFSWWWVGFDPSVLWQGNTWTLAGRVLADAVPPTFGGQSPLDLLGLAGITVSMSVIAITVAFFGGALLAFPSARLPWLGLRRRSGGLLWTIRSGLCKLILVLLRAIPPPVWALLFLFVFYPGVLPGALALGVYTAGVLGRLMAEAAENLDGRPLRALRAHGTAEPLVFCYAVLPAVTPKFVAYGLYRWEVAIRETVVVGVVGAGGLGLLLNQQLASFDYAASLTTVAALILLTLVVDLGSAALRRALR
ncbi:PhnE/PtxC family ABC transporter permease [Labedaea rhizosphaerae]|uniref:Phosphonate transport system permease protein n=1 Tax=Labedaea rhizosphaerae TaxID=598644 RepID=A0A4R6SHD1_LABRH|nr:ABC transporter permease subunit [Labedaea rhizosphaerae]TDQ00338.1 phosphonate transport system permease protein [Labedaea rhizosphaerae]